MATSPIAEVTARWIMDGTAQRLVQIQRERVAMRQGVVREVLGEYVLGSRPNALSAWLRVPDAWEAERITRELRNRNIAVTSPDPFLVRGADRPNAVPFMCRRGGQRRHVSRCNRNDARGFRAISARP